MGRDAITGLVIFVTSLFLYWATLGLKRHPLVPVGPEFYPRLVLGVTAFLAPRYRSATEPPTTAIM